jgi:DNA-binding response OmpR family regulator
MDAKRTILVVDDEPHIVLGLKDALEFEGFRVVTATSGKEAVQLARQERPNAILLDLMLPDKNGYQICEEVRRFDVAVPILMLTARSQESDKIRGLDAGADDYVTKPFSLGELIARLRALFRRAQRPAEVSNFRIGNATVNVAAQTLQRDGKKAEQLSFYETELLRLLHERQGQPVSREEILNKIWGIDANPSNRTIDNFIVKLRKKVEKKPEEPMHILTVYGFGYKLVNDAE